MKIAAVHAIADLVTPDALSESHIIPSALNKEIGVKVAEAVYKAAVESGVSRI
jgi:malate dehydrogenase (oxaloacetate-decarboxylating)